ncbi:hypothetical protein [Stomatohabitans albus]|uniref:hypothetical protein n=1 Tax=Stomatohabitans albus TaxID=3110766 RepID=UPI00300C759C
MAFSLRKPKGDDAPDQSPSQPSEETTTRFSLGRKKHTVPVGPTSVGVILLPPRYADARRSKRVLQISIIAGTLCISAMALGSALVWRHTQEMIAERDAQKVRVDTLQSQVTALNEFKAQADRLANANDNLKLVMSSEVSWARMLNDLSMTVPATATLEGFSANIEPAAAYAVSTSNDPSVVPSEGATPDPNEPPKPPISIGDISIEGYSIEKYSPGVESVLARFDEVLSYSDVFLSSTSATKAEGVLAGSASTTVEELTKSQFSTNIKIGPAALTGRYRNGLPETGE